MVVTCTFQFFYHDVKQPKLMLKIGLLLMTQTARHLLPVES